LCSFFQLLAIVDVVTGHMPTDNLSSFVPQRIVLGQEPAVLTVPTTRTPLLEWNPAREIATSCRCGSQPGLQSLSQVAGDGGLSVESAVINAEDGAGRDDFSVTLKSQR